jgi:hypothetical protein
VTHRGYDELIFCPYPDVLMMQDRIANNGARPLNGAMNGVLSVMLLLGQQPLDRAS